MATLGELHTTISSALARGTALDAQIPTYLRQAARWVERNQTYQYMRKNGIVLVDLASDYPQVVQVPNPNWKSIDGVRLIPPEAVGATRSYYQIGKVNPNDISFLESGLPNGYYLNGTEQLVLNRTPLEALSVEIFWTEFTSWPTAPQATNWLLLNGEDLLLNQTLIMMGNYLRDPRMIQTYISQRDEAIKTLSIAQDEMDWSNMPSTMNFAPEGGLIWPDSDYRYTGEA